MKLILPTYSSPSFKRKILSALTSRMNVKRAVRSFLCFCFFFTTHGFVCFFLSSPLFFFLRRTKTLNRLVSCFAQRRSRKLMVYVVVCVCVFFFFNAMMHVYMAKQRQPSASVKLLVLLEE